MYRFYVLMVFSTLLICPFALAGDKLVLEFDSDDLLSLSHNIDDFFSTPTRNYQGEAEQNVNDMSAPALKNHLVVTGLVRMNGEVVGLVTEQEIVHIDEETKRATAESMWMFRLNYPGLTGFMSVLQREEASSIVSLIQEVASNQDKQWEDKWQMFLSTAGKAHVQFASGELSKFQGGKFEEYNGLNPADLARQGEFRVRVQFVIYPRE
ncbi:MAG: hypothetical protein GXP16_02235 [Gammaproteobacteria bacterium]|nr:hypothetical protein [Gammaproteobacteria bacterium]